jgi:hypothetical protein
MKGNSFTKAVDKYVAVQMAAIDVIIEKYIDPLEDIGNPEQLIGKKYSECTPEDFQKLSQVYGTQEPSPLSNWIFNNKYKEVQAMKLEEK